MTTLPSSGSIALLRARFLPERNEGVDAVLAIDGRIRRLGPSATIAALAPPDAVVVDLEGRTLLPGFVDGHAHFLQAGLRAARLDLSNAASLEEALELVDEALRGGPAAAPERTNVFVAEAWDETRWIAHTPPTRDALDHLAPQRPVVLRRVCGHAAVANSVALELLGAARGWGGIDRATGLLLEAPALALDSLFRPDEAAIDAAVDAAAQLWFSRGVTTTCDFLRGDLAAHYSAYRARRRLPLRVVAYVVEDDPSTPAAVRGMGPPPDDCFHLAGRKIFTDGSIGARTAALFAPYADRPGNTGQLLLDADAVATAAARAADAGESLAVHAIGDRAIAAALDAFAQFPAATNRALRHRVEHFELPRPGDADRLAALGVRPCMQPNFVAQWGGAGGLYETALGAERVRTMNPLRTTLRAECGLFFGSDGMPLAPLYGVRAAAAHPNANERLGPSESIRLYTEDSAAALVADPDFGRIAEGCAADFVALPPGFDATPAEADDVVDLTVVAGRIVHIAASFTTHAAPRAALRARA